MFVAGVNGSIISNAPSGSRLKGAYKNSKKRKMPNGGSVLFREDYDLTKAPKKGNYLLPDINRPFYTDETGGRRSEYKMGFNIHGKETLIPSVVNGRQLTEDEALDRYLSTGLHMGQFNTPEEANYAARLRTARYNMLEDPIKFQAKRFKDGGTLPPRYTSNPRDPRINRYADSLNSDIPFKGVDINQLKKGGEVEDDDDKEMVEGVASILRDVKDKKNRLQLANKLAKQFNREKVKYDLPSFLAKSKVKK